MPPTGVEAALPTAIHPSPEPGQLLRGAWDLIVRIGGRLAAIVSACLAPGALASLGGAEVVLVATRLRYGPGRSYHDGFDTRGFRELATQLEILGALLTLLGAVVALGAATDLALEAIAMRPLSIRRSLEAGFRRSRPVLVIGAGTGLAVGVGMTLCCVPGVLLMTLVVMAVPAAMAEGLGARAAVRRSYDLAERSHLAIGAVFVAVFVVHALLASAAAYAGDSVRRLHEVVQSVDLRILALAIEAALAFVVEGACFAFYVALSVVTYADRAGRGPARDPEALASVFR